MVQIKTGTTRRVVLVGRLAFKTPRFSSWESFLKGLLANLRERSWSGFSERLCPVYFAMWGGFLSVMPRTTDLTDDQWSSFDTASYRSFCSNRGSFIPVERKRTSFGILRGEIVAVNYGTRN